MAREQVPLVVIQRQLGHGNLGITSIYLQGIDSSEIDHRHRPRTPSTHDPRQRRTTRPALTDFQRHQASHESSARMDDKRQQLDRVETGTLERRG